MVETPHLMSPTSSSSSAQNAESLLIRVQRLSLTAQTSTVGAPTLMGVCTSMGDVCFASSCSTFANVLCATCYTPEIPSAFEGSCISICPSIRGPNILRVSKPNKKTTTWTRNTAAEVPPRDYMRMHIKKICGPYREIPPKAPQAPDDAIPATVMPDAVAKPNIDWGGWT